jgi:micrococcal nuclease
MGGRMKEGENKTSSKFWHILLFLVIIFSIWTIINHSQNNNREYVPPQTPTPTIAPTQAPLTSVTKVLEVIDGDTIIIETGETVRLLGINAPELGEPYYEDTRNRLIKLIKGQTIILERDVSDIDSEGRLLRYVFKNWNDNINVRLVKEGLAHVHIKSPDVKYQSDLFQAENEAQNLKIGMWATPAPKSCNKCMEVVNLHWNAEGDDCINLNDEFVVFRNNCPYSCDLTGWKVKDESSRPPYTFRYLIVGGGELVTLFTGCGYDSGGDIYWCSNGYDCNAIWNNNGDTLYMWNSDGELVLKYKYSGFPLII